MKEENLISYQKLDDRDGIKTYFRKFDSATWIFQFNEEGENIGSVCISGDTLKAINNAPPIKLDDARTK